MIEGPALVAALTECGVTDVVWIPDTHLGAWDAALRAAPNLRLVRVCRESEAIGVAAGLLLGGRRPVVMVQCTGFFDAGDALRNVVHEMKLPLFLVVGIRSLVASRGRGTSDTCPTYAEPIVRTWQLPYVLLDERATAADLAAAYRQARDEGRAGAALLAE